MTAAHKAGSDKPRHLSELRYLQCLHLPSGLPNTTYLSSVLPLTFIFQPSYRTKRVALFNRLALSSFVNSHAFESAFALLTSFLKKWAQRRYMRQCAPLTKGITKHYHLHSSSSFGHQQAIKMAVPEYRDEGKAMPKQQNKHTP